MAQLRVYAQMADNVYKVPDLAAVKTDLPSEWKVLARTSDGAAGLDGAGGFKGCIFRNDHELVVAFKGTGGGHLFRDLLADAKLAAGVIPREATAANQLTRQALTYEAPENITLVGHSLGGGLCQVVAHWYKIKFVTFNAPPMSGCIQKSKLNVFKPQQMGRAIKATFKSGVGGINYRCKGDIVSSRMTSVGGHYGKVVKLSIPAAKRHRPDKCHLMTIMLDYLKTHAEGRDEPFGRKNESAKLFAQAAMTATAPVMGG